MKAYITAATLIVFHSFSFVAFGSDDDTIELFEMANDTYANDFQLSYEQPSVQQTDDEQMTNAMPLSDEELDVNSSSY